MRRVIMGRENVQEVPDPTPIHIPGADRPLTIREEMQRFIREEISRAAVVNDGAGSFEEEDDFSEDGGENDFLSQYSVIELHPEEEDYRLTPTGGDPAKAEGQGGTEQDPPDDGPESSEGLSKASTG